MQNTARKNFNGTYSQASNQYSSISGTTAPAITQHPGYSLQGNPSWNGTNNDGFYGSQPVMTLNPNVAWQQPVAFYANQAQVPNGGAVPSGFAGQPFQSNNGNPVVGISYPALNANPVNPSWNTGTNPGYTLGTNAVLASQNVTGINQSNDSLFPPCDVKETIDSYLFQADVPGIKDNQIEISLFGNQMSVSGKREAEQRKNGETLFVAERAHGSFSRIFTLPENVNTNKVQAELKDGVLCITLPKNAATPSKKVTVSSKK